MCEKQNRKRLSEGEKAPEFELRGLDGAFIRSSELRKKGPVLLTFYRGAWCGCCQADLRDVVNTMPQLKEEGLAAVIGVFYGLSPETNARICEEYGLGFPLVNDEEGRVAEMFGIRRTASELAEVEKEMGSVPLALKGGEPWILPMQARFLIGTDGMIARCDVVFNYEDRCELKDLIPALKRLG
jgi:peroxiredoxin